MKMELAKSIEAVWDEIIEETKDELSTEQIMARTVHDVQARGILKTCDAADVSEALWITQQKRNKR